MSVNDIKSFLGMVTNVDPEDIQDEYCQLIDGFEPLGSLLRKSFGGGGYFAGGETPPSIAGYKFVNVTNFVSDKMALGAPYNVSGNMEIFLYISTTTGLVKLYGWDGVDTYRDITTLAPFSLIQNLYLRYALKYKNPMIQAGDTLRILSGKAGYAGSQLLQNGWIGWIDRKMYNGLYTIDPKYYIMPSSVPADIGSDLTITLSKQTVSSDPPGDPVEYYYRYSLVYDYSQEGLLSDTKASVVLYDNEAVVIKVELEETPKYIRLTSVNIYRSRYRNYGFMKIASINTVVNPDEAIMGEDASCIKKIFFNKADMEAHDFTFGATYEIRIQVDDSGSWRDLVGGDIRFLTSGYGNRVLEIDDFFSWGWNDAYSGNPIVQWSLWTDSMAELISTGDGTNLQFDKNVIYFAHTKASYIRAGDYIYIEGGTGITNGIYIIENVMYDDNGNTSIALNNNVLSNIINAQNGIKYVIFRDSNPGYVTGYSGYTAEMIVFDNHLPELSEHPLVGEVSTHVNANYAHYYNGRMFLLDCVLDPEGAAEEHNDLLMYSEYLQPDVVPVSNAISCDNPLGGGGVGLAQFFNSLLIIMKHTIYQLYPSNIVNPITWSLTESPHRIGCVSSNAFVVAGGSLYVTYYDGIYEFTPNMLAESDRTPVDAMRISEPINDVFMQLTDAQKEAVVMRHDILRGEVVVDGLSSGKSYCYSIPYKSWRVQSYYSDGVSDSKEFTTKESSLVVYDDGTGAFVNINSASPGQSATLWKSKIYTNVYDKKEILRDILVTYLSEDDITVSIYDAENDISPIIQKVLPGKTKINSERLGLRIRANKYYIKITTPSSTNPVEVYRVRIKGEDSSEQ